MTENTLPEIKGLAAQVKNLKDTFGVMQQDLEEMEARQAELLNQLANKGLLNLSSVKKNAELQLEYDQLTVAIQSLTDRIKEMKMALTASDGSGLSQAETITRLFSEYGQQLATEKHRTLVEKLSPLWNEMVKIQVEALKENNEIHSFMVDEASKVTGYLPFESQVRIKNAIESWGYPVKNVLESPQAMYSNPEFTRI
ncbi:hypothetical protein [Trichococcus pasteurii]|uniref:Uncharacterized protein n=1 Tax=Trichococcus pasteurii TaxID=43064 RepID=A0A1W1ICW0_9LACT|nr:hypothetical protein [Trichococcus pasteurii]SFE37025.1 hypothetical protein SAMN04488086_10341 [Trichococcus pasteurii]SLM50868.1 Hypothetical protein TPAS_540 [Trichococcus pasteurii]SSB91749.1 Hypothetical protein TPAS_540 [Trichococcus pasteurii]